MKPVDCHVHLWTKSQIKSLVSICEDCGYDHANIVSLTDRVRVNGNPEAFAAKAEFPETFYVFAGLDHSPYFSSGKLPAPSLAEQVDRLIATGVDGIKMLENKPTTRKELDIPADSDYFEGYFTRLEDTGLPVLWHVADPEEFWDPEKVPGWARDAGWFYDQSYVSKEQLYTEVEHVLQRHPRLKIIFAHFYFLSADLPRASAFLDRFSGVHFDLAPGIELLHNMSKDVDKTREFFVRYSNRILYGTDIMANQSRAEAKARAKLVRRWLETDDVYRTDEASDELLGSPDEGLIRGLALPKNALERIYHANFERIAGEMPKRLNLGLVEEECRRISDLRFRISETAYSPQGTQRSTEGDGDDSGRQH